MPIEWSVIEFLLEVLSVLGVLFILLNHFYEEKKKAEE